jgi:hypothetical protein
MMILETVLSDRYVCQISCFSPQVKYLGIIGHRDFPHFQDGYRYNKMATFSYCLASSTVYLLSYLSMFGRFVVYFCITKLCTRYFNHPILKKKAK